MCVIYFISYPFLAARKPFRYFASVWLTPQWRLCSKFRTVCMIHLRNKAWYT